MRRLVFIISLCVCFALSANGAGAENIARGVRVIVIDAGHGGPKFPGAHYRGIYEKDLNLKVALKLGALIERELPEVKVVYTRKTDKQFSESLTKDLQARADIANKAEGDLFFSIHTNAAPTAAARGVETLIMGESPLEQRINDEVLFANNKEEFIDMSDQRTAAIVRAYISNLRFTYGEYSEAMARLLEKNYKQAGRYVRKTKPQLLKVLYATNMPGVLTEIGFMSNAQEMAYMKSEKGQDEIARSIYEGVRDYSAYVLETRRAEEEAAAAPKPGKEPETQVVIGKEPVRPAEQDKASDAPAAKTVTPEKGEPEKAAGKSGAQKPEPRKPAKAGDAPKQAARPLRYTVQVLASAQTVPTSSARFKAYRNKVKQYTAEGRFRYKYCVGEYDTRAAAQKRLAEVRKVFPDAFVVCCRGTQIVK